MSQSSFMKRKGGNIITKKMMAEKMDEMAALCTLLETTLMEWEVWYRLVKSQKKNMSPTEWEHVVNDGPIFTDMTEKVMESIRQNVPSMERTPEEEMQDKKPAILDASGNVASDKKVDIIK